MKSQTTLNDLEDEGIGKKTSDLPGEMKDQTDMAATIEETTEEIGAIEIEIETGEITGLILEMIDGIETENGIEIGETIEVTEFMVEKEIMTKITQEIKMKKVAATMIEGQDQDQVTVDNKEELHKNKKKVLFVKLQRKDVP